MSIATETRAVYQKQHERIAADDEAFQRIYNIYANADFGIPDEWWPGKYVLDVGCGNFGAFFLWLLDRGPEMVHGIDVGHDWIDGLTKSLTSRSAAPNRFKLYTGSVLGIPCSTAGFDFVAINGVLVHLASMDEIRLGFVEGARVTKTGGYLYTSYGPCGGAMMAAIFPALQKYYRENVGFKAFIDTIDPMMIHDAIDLIERYVGNEVPPGYLKSLFGEDYCVFLQNYIQRPTDFSNECTPEFVENLYRQHGFTNVRRLTHYVKRTDIRKFFAPLHFHWDHPVAIALYGEGFVQYIGEKA